MLRQMALSNYLVFYSVLGGGEAVVHTAREKLVK